MLGHSTDTVADGKTNETNAQHSNAALSN